MRFFLTLILFVAAALLVGHFAYQAPVNLTVLLLFLGVFLLLSGFFFLGRNRTEQKDFDRWLESHKRLSDPDHACALHLLGYTVPPYYLPPFEARTKEPVHMEAVLFRYSKADDLGPAPPPKPTNRPHSAIPQRYPGRDSTKARYSLLCPHRGFLLETKSALHCRSGKILNTCPACRGTYADPYSTEIALERYESSSAFQEIVSSLGTAFILSLITSFIVFCITWDTPYFFQVLAVATAILWLLSLIFLPVRRRKDKAWYKLLWEESDHRLRDPAYAFLLKQAGYYVPVRYLPSYYSDGQPESVSFRPLRITRVNTPPDSTPL